MKTHLYTKDRVACGELPDHSPMIRDPAAVDCERCRKTIVFNRVQNAEQNREQNRNKKYNFEQQGLFDYAAKEQIQNSDGV